MMKLSKTLRDLAERATTGAVTAEFGGGSDYQGELALTWDGRQFFADLVVYSDPHTTYGGWYDPPETQWREQEDKFDAIKIRDVANWLKTEWGFDLEA